MKQILLKEYDSAFKLQNSAKPIILKKDNDKAVLCIHGYTGYSHEYEYLSHELFKNNYDVYAIRLPGHGTSRNDIEAVTHEEYIRKVLDSYIDLKSEYKKVAVIGHSMGGLLSIILGTYFKIDTMVLLAPALDFKNKSMKYIPILRHFCSTIKDNQAKPDNRVDSDFYFNEYQKDNLILPLFELITLKQIANMRLKKLKTNLLVLYGQNDSIVSDKIFSTIKKNVVNSQIECMIFEKSNHLLLDGIEKESVAKKIVSFLKVNFI